MREPLRPAVIAPWRPAALALLAALAGCGRDPLACGGEAMPLAEARRLAAGGEARGPVTVEGVVAADFAGGLGGFFLAAPEGEPEAALFVAAAIPGLAPGTRLRLSAEPARLPPEMHGRPALVRVSGHRACGTARPPVTELKAPPEDWEALEGRPVRIASPLLLAGHGELAARGELIVAFGGERPFQPTELFPPGEPAQRFAREQRRRLLVLDDGREAPPAGGLPWFWTEPPARLRIGGRLDRRRRRGGPG
ncbi:MAG: hypothetical protein RML12_00640 [Xanthomonadales bacterium]|nr:hypothetical protein [Xanthomonadales bacterium]